MTWLKIWFRSLFLPVRTYQVFVWSEHRWWPAGTIQATSWSHARKVAAKQNRGYQVQITEEE